jgi:hypothetical protein
MTNRTRTVSLLRRPQLVSLPTQSRRSRRRSRLPANCVVVEASCTDGSGSPSNGKHAANRKLRAARPGRVRAAEFGGKLRRELLDVARRELRQ